VIRVRWGRGDFERLPGSPLEVPGHVP
jgi:hypothetical protein